jgi:predicted RNA-binding protein YlxR (DUF448 family)
VPERPCVGCGTTGAKRSFVRIVRGPDGTVQIDDTGKKPGRGAYLHSDANCWNQALKKKRLEYSLKVSLSPHDVAALEAFAGALQPSEAVQ